MFWKFAGFSSNVFKIVQVFLFYDNIIAGHYAIQENILKYFKSGLRKNVKT